MSDTVRQPRLKIAVNGADLPQRIAIEAEVGSNGYYAADTFRAKVALNADPTRGLLWWDGLAGQGTTATPILIEIFAALDGGQSWSSLFVGEVDHMDPDLPNGEMVIQGRDLSRRFIDAKTQQTFQNQTSSQVAALLAERRGLTSVVTPTKTPTGRFYSTDHERLIENQFSNTTTEWDLLCRLAREEGFVVYVKGRALHFEPKPTASTTPILRVSWDNTAHRSNVIDLRLTRALTLAKDIVVRVTSWNSAHEFAVVKYSPNKGDAALRSGKAQLYPLTRPNLTDDAAQKLADEYRAQLTAHERVVDFDMPGDLTFQPHSVITVQGDVGSWAQTYYIDQVTRRISFEGGFMQHVRAKNASPDLNT